MTPGKIVEKLRILTAKRMKALSPEVECNFFEPYSRNHQISIHFNVKGLNIILNSLRQNSFLIIL